MKIHGSLALKLCLCAVAAAPLAVATTPPTLSASPSAVFFEYNPPEPMPLPVFVTVTASNASTPTIAAAISAGSGTPVTLFPGPAVTGDKLQVYYDNATFEQLSSQPGVYTATITVTASGFTALKIPVTLNIGGPLSIIPSATTLSFFVPGPTSQSVSLSASGGASIGFSVAFTTSGGGNWLSVVSNQSYTPATLTVTVNSLNIAGGTYQGAVTVTPTSGNTTPLVIPITLQVGPNTLTASPVSFSFAYNAGGTVPLAQVLTLSSPVANDTYVAQAVSNGDWLLINGATSNVSGTLPTDANLNVTVNPAGLNIGTYQGSITATDADNGTETIPVTLTITAVSNVANPESLVFVTQLGQAAPRAALGDQRLWQRLVHRHGRRIVDRNLRHLRPGARRAHRHRRSHRSAGGHLHWHDYNRSEYSYPAYPRYSDRIRESRTYHGFRRFCLQLCRW